MSANIIWLAVFIPIIFLMVGAILFHSKYSWWEYVLSFVVPILLIIICKTTSESIQTRDTEYWNTYVTKITYYEPWNERVSCRHPKYCDRMSTCTSHSNGKTTTRPCMKRVRCGDQHAYDVDYHSEYWQATNNMGNGYSISKSTYSQYKQLWNNEKFRDMSRHYHTIDGDAYFTIYNNDPTKIISITEAHSYENRVQAASSVFNFDPVDTSDISRYKLFEYPSIKDIYNYQYILGDNGIHSNKMMQYYNGIYGSNKKIHMMLLVFKDQPIKAGMLQRNYWKGSNKNEFIVCVGLNTSNNKVDWAYSITWSEEQRLKVDVESDIPNMGKYDLDSIVTYMGTNIPNRFVKKSFQDFSYLTVEPSTTAIVWTYIITFIVSAGLFAFAILNPFNLRENDSSSYLDKKKRNY